MGDIPIAVIWGQDSNDGNRVHKGKVTAPLLIFQQKVVSPQLGSRPVGRPRPRKDRQSCQRRVGVPASTLKVTVPGGSIPPLGTTQLTPEKKHRGYMSMGLARPHDLGPHRGLTGMWVGGERGGLGEPVDDRAERRPRASGWPAVLSWWFGGAGTGPEQTLRDFGWLALSTAARRLGPLRGLTGGRWRASRQSGRREARDAGD